MKKILIYMSLLGAVLLLPMQGTDVGKLQPVELVYIYREAETVKVETDLGEMGTGTTVGEAIENLKATTSGIVFLDTADYALIDETAKEEIEDLKVYLKPSTRVCMLQKEADLKKAAEYLQVHKPKLYLQDANSDSKMEILANENERFELKKD